MRCTKEAKALQRKQLPAQQAPRRVCKVQASATPQEHAPQHQPAQAKQARRAGGPLIDRRQLLTGAAVSTISFLGGCACPVCDPAGPVNINLGVGAAQAAEWNYGDLSGPSKWGGTCQIGMRQSPIDIKFDSSQMRKDLGRFTFNYSKFEGCEVLNTGHGTPQVIFPPGNIAMVGDLELELLQFHFHSPSEHSFDGERMAMEVHLVHRNRETGGLAVLGIMMEPGGETKNDALATALERVPREPLASAPAEKPVNPLLFLPIQSSNNPVKRPYVHYAGSLTTPPCSEGVEWYVFTTPILVPDSQVLAFARFAGGGKTYAQNSRPVQPMQDRVLEFKPI